MVDFPAPDEPDQRGHRARRRCKNYVVQHFLARVVRETDVFHRHVSFDAVQRDGAAGGFVFLFVVQDFARALQPGDRFGDLRADRHDLKHRRDQQHQERVERQPLAGCHSAADDGVSAEFVHQRADDAHHRHARQTHQRGRRDRLQDVVEQPLHSGGEDRFLAIFRVISLHHANAAERFRQAAGDFGGDFRTRSKNGANGLEGLADRRCQKPQLIPKAMLVIRTLVCSRYTERQDGGHQAADEFDQSRADQIAYAFHVAHDARDENAGFVRVVKRNRQPADVRLHLSCAGR